MFLYLSLTGLIYLFLMYTTIFKKKILTEGWISIVIKAIFFIPFWSVFLYYVTTLTAPIIYDYFKPAESTQEFTIVSDDSQPVKFLVLGRNYNSNNWQAAYPSGVYLPKGNMIWINPGETKKMTYRFGSRDLDYITFKRVDNYRATKDTVREKTIKLPNIPVFLKTNDFKTVSNFSNYVTPNFKEEINILIVSFLSFIGFIYHAIKLKKKLIVRLLIYIPILGGLAISAHYAYYVGRYVFYYLF